MPLEYALQHRGKFPDLGPWKVSPARKVSLTAKLGIDALPRQKLNRIKRHCFVFNIMVVGESGLGKTTFMNTLFNADLTPSITPEAPQDHKTVQIESNSYELSEDGVILKLTVIDTPGFGDQLNRKSNLQPIIDYIDDQFEMYHGAERSSDFRTAIPDTRVHAMLYFIPPTGHALRELDIETLKSLSEKVNIIPVIAKADTLTLEERVEFKKNVLADIQRHNILVYPTAHSEERGCTAALEKHIPFTVIGSNSFIEVSGKLVRGRQYRWGIAEVENDQHCDFVWLRELLMDTCLHDLMETTHTRHYALYRAQQLRSKGRPESILACDDMYETRVEATKQKLGEEMLKREEEIRLNFVAQVREKEATLREREEQLNQARQQMMAELEKERARLEAEEREIDVLLAQHKMANKGIFRKF